MVTCYCKNCNKTFIPDGGQTGVASTCPYCGKRAEMHSQLYWCQKCNVPIYDEICPECHEKGIEFTTDARPVFPKECLLLEVLLGKPMAFQNDSVWCSTGSRYYVNGEAIAFASSKYKNADPVAVKATIEQYEMENADESAFNAMIERWIKANQGRFSHITHEARRYIESFASKYINDEKYAMFVSFSGGKDSTVVSDLVRKALGRPDIIHIFGNTTLEFPETYEYIKRFKAENRKTPMLRAENKEQDFYNLCETFGPPSRSLRWFCTIFKTGFIGDKLIRTFGENTKILTFNGIRRHESASRNTYDRESKEGVKISRQSVASPIIDWFDYDIWLYLLTERIDFNDAYRYGYTRVDCWCCPNNSHSKIFSPDENLVNQGFSGLVSRGKSSTTGSRPMT